MPGLSAPVATTRCCTSRSAPLPMSTTFWISNLDFHFLRILICDFLETGSAPKPPVALHHFQCQQHSHVCCFRFFITSKIFEHWSVMSCPVPLKIFTTRDLKENAHMITIFKGLPKECNPISTIHNNKIVDQISIHLRATKFLFEIATN